MLLQFTEMHLCVEFATRLSSENMGSDISSSTQLILRAHLFLTTFKHKCCSDKKKKVPPLLSPDL